MRTGTEQRMADSGDEAIFRTAIDDFILGQLTVAETHD